MSVFITFYGRVFALIRLWRLLRKLARRFGSLYRFIGRLRFEFQCCTLGALFLLVEMDFSWQLGNDMAKLTDKVETKYGKV